MAGNKRVEELACERYLKFWKSFGRSFKMEYNLFDEYPLFVNPVIAGQGIPVFSGIREKINLKRMSTKVFLGDVTELSYLVKR